jgi:hypothetical protein
MMLIALLLATPTAAVDPAWSAHLDTELFSTYHYVDAEAGSFNEFTLPRAEAGVRFESPRHWGGELRLEAVRSASPDGVVGIDGNSLVLRVKRAQVSWSHELGPLDLAVHGGLVAEPWVEAIEGHYPWRDLSATSGERAGLLDTSDLGLRATARLWDNRIRLVLGATNGEGRAQRELNDGKNFTGVLSVDALHTDSLQLGVHVLGRDGSLGGGSARNHRFGGALTASWKDLGAGVEFVQAEGVDGRSDQRTQVLGTWLGGSIWRGLGGFARFDLVRPDLTVEGASRSSVLAAVYWEQDGARAAIHYEGRTATDQAADLPGVSASGSDNRVGLNLSWRGAFAILNGGDS